MGSLLLVLLGEDLVVLLGDQLFLLEQEIKLLFELFVGGLEKGFCLRYLI